MQNTSENNYVRKDIYSEETTESLKKGYVALLEKLGSMGHPHPADDDGDVCDSFN